MRWIKLLFIVLKTGNATLDGLAPGNPHFDEDAHMSLAVGMRVIPP